jgi:hypothetical protein
MSGGDNLKSSSEQLPNNCLIVYEKRRELCVEFSFQEWKKVRDSLIKTKLDFLFLLSPPTSCLPLNVIPFTFCSVETFPLALVGIVFDFFRNFKFSS